MVSHDELERLSRYLANELASDEAAELERELHERAELAAALTSMRAIDAQLPTLEDGLSESAGRTLVAGVLQRQRPAVAAWAAGAIAACLLGVTAYWLVASASPQVVAVGGQVRVDREPAALLAATFQTGAHVATDGDSGALISSGRQVLRVPQHSEVAREPGLWPKYRVERGAVVVSGSGVELIAGPEQLSIDGLAFVSLEPSPPLHRVTEVTRFASGGHMKWNWMKLGPLTAAAAAGSALTLFVMEGRANVSAPDHDPIEVSAGETWQRGEPKAKPLAASRAALASSDGEEQSTDSAATSTPSVSAQTTREELVALVEKLRDEKEVALREKHELKHKLEQASQKKNGNYFRLTPDELNESVARGEVRLRLPQLDGGSLKYDSEVASDVGLRSEEERAIREIYKKSYERIRDELTSLYRAIGGDASVASTLSTQAIIQELGTKAVPGESEAAVRKIARERAGMQPVGQGGPAIEQAYRFLWQEDDRVVAELEKLLGPARAEQLLNHPKTSHSDYTTGVGPEKPAR